MTAKKIKIDYQRWTFILSVVGFVGSIGFYLGVLRQVYGPDQAEQKMHNLEAENVKLQEAVYVLTEELKGQKNQEQ